MMSYLQETRKQNPFNSTPSKGNSSKWQRELDILVRLRLPTLLTLYLVESKVDRLGERLEFVDDAVSKIDWVIV